MDHLSCSQMNLYMWCPLKYKFQYIDKLPKPFKPSGLAFGGSLHAALCWLNRHRINGQDVRLDRVYKVFDADWFAQGLDTKIRYKNGENANKLTILGKELLSLYFVRPHRKVKQAEMSFTVPLVNTATGEKLPINLEGFIDLIEEGGDITEYKTSNQAMNETAIENHLQLTGYSYAYELLYRRPPRSLKLVDFVKTRKPKIIPLEADRNKLDYQRFFYLAKQIFQAIKAGIFFPRQSFMCKDCEYAEPCKAWRGN